MNLLGGLCETKVEKLKEEASNALRKIKAE